MSIERDQAASILDALVSLLRTSRTIAHREGQHSVSATPITLLRLIRTSEPRLGDLAGQLRVKPSVASRTVAALESDGYLTRVTDPEDARACRVQITAAGRTLLAERENQVLQELALTFDDWTAEEAAGAVRLLNRIETSVLDWTDRLGRQQLAHPARPGAMPDTPAAPGARAETDSAPAAPQGTDDAVPSRTEKGTTDDKRTTDKGTTDKEMTTV